jgi:hypothetical protein
VQLENIAHQSKELADEYSHNKRKQQVVKLPPGRPKKLQNIDSILSSHPTDNTVVASDPALRIDWFSSPFVHDILQAYKLCRTGYSTVQHLQQHFPRLPTETKGRFHDLSVSTVDGWFDEQHQLKPQYAARILGDYRGRSRTHCTEMQVFFEHRDLEEKIINTLQSMRAAGNATKIRQVRMVMQAFIMKYNPDLISEFKLGKGFISGWVHSKLKWTIRRGTTAAGHLPADWKEQGKI